MALKGSFLNRLFGSDSEEEEKEERVQRERKRTAEPESSKPAQDKPEPPRREPPKVDLPRDHALFQLWGLWGEQAPGTPSPRLYMEMPPEQDYALSEDEIKRELLRLNVSITATANKRIAKTRTKENEPIPEMDAQVVVFVTSNRLTAWMLIYPPVGGGREIERDMISQALRENKVGFGVDEELISRLPGEQEKYFKMFLVARGKKAYDGQDGCVVDFFPRKIQREATVDESGKMDYTSLNFVQNVKMGDSICQIVPPTLGVQGRSVYDQEIAARDGRAAVVPQGRNTKLSDDGGMLVAVVAGHVEFNGQTFQVNPVLEIEGNVDYSTGNINFLGDVHVHGDVCGSFNVRATGNITVDGVVESSTVEAGCDLIVVKGVQGNEQAVIRAHRSIYAKYLENCNVYVREDLQADCILNCEVYSDGAVEVRSGRGIIIGGNIHAAREVSANIVGSRSESVTTVHIGGLPFEEFEYENLEEELNKQEEELERAEQMPESPVKSGIVGRMRTKVASSQKRLEQFAEDLEKLKENVQKRSGGRLDCGVVYPGTVINIGKASLRVERETRLCTAMLIDGEIRLQ